MKKPTLKKVIKLEDSFESYQGHVALNASGIKNLIKGALKKTDTSSLSFGRRVHFAVEQYLRGRDVIFEDKPRGVEEVNRIDGDKAVLTLTKTDRMHMEACFGAFKRFAMENNLNSKTVHALERSTYIPASLITAVSKLPKWLVHIHQFIYKAMKGLKVRPDIVLKNEDGSETWIDLKTIKELDSSVEDIERTHKYKYDYLTANAVYMYASHLSGGLIKEYKTLYLVKAKEQVSAVCKTLITADEQFMKDVFKHTEKLKDYNVADLEERFSRALKKDTIYI